MPAWDSEQYLQFVEERTQPARDLAARVSLAAPRRVIDLGCGPGNSTRVLANRWPLAELTGLDSSAQMIESARRADPSRQWIVGDIAAWAESPQPSFDVIFSNAALQWVDDHLTLFPRLMKRLNPGGARAIQVPGNLDAPAHSAMRQIAALHAWRDHFPKEGVREWHVHDLPFYYDVLAPSAGRLELWETEYLHVMPSAQAIVEWYKGTGLRPFLQGLASDELRERFIEEYLEQIRQLYPPRGNGRVLFPFRRLFMIAYRPAQDARNS
ncbi:MAG TPA: trans-aconitate 2-methyltransferase [Bradyrhizobium sp.]